MVKNIEYSYNNNYTKVNPNEYNTIYVETNAKPNNNNKFTFEAQNGLNEASTRIDRINKLSCTWRDVYQIFLSNKMCYEAGDAIGLIVPNSDVLIDKLMDICGFTNDFCKIVREGKDPFVFVGYLKDFFKYKMDLKSLPKKLQLLNLAKKANKKNELEYLASKEGFADYMKLGINWNDIVEIIEEFECRPSIEDLIINCEVIKPRYYSLINKKENNIEILVGLISKTDKYTGKKKLGHVSGFINEIYNNNNEYPAVEYVFRKNKLTTKLNSENLISFCTGTGIAPFISVYRNSKPNQKLNLIYGYRNDEDDLSKIFKIKCNITRCKTAQKNM